MARNPLKLFDPNPPESDQDLAALFHNREVELRDALDALSVADLPRLPLVIHGPSRSGKSHFARLLVQRLGGPEGRFEPLVVADDLE